MQVHSQTRAALRGALRRASGRNGTQASKRKAHVLLRGYCGSTSCEERTRRLKKIGEGPPACTPEEAREVNAILDSLRILTDDDDVSFLDL